MNLKVMSIELQWRACYKYSDVCQTCVPLHLIRQGRLMSCGWKHKNSSSSSSLCVCGCILPLKWHQSGKKAIILSKMWQTYVLSAKCLLGKITALFSGLLWVTESELMGALSSLVFSDDREVLAIRAPDITVIVRVDFLNWSVNRGCADTSPSARHSLHLF